MNEMINLIQEEIRRSNDIHGPFIGFHEAYAVIQEEVDELWDEIKRRDRDKEKIEREAIQVAAMALKLALTAKELNR